MRSTIICGLDCSPYSRAAARLAIRLAHRLNQPLELLHVIERATEPSSRSGLAAIQAVLQEEPDRHGIGIRIQTGAAAEVLRRAGERARLLVIGSRGESAGRQEPVGEECRELMANPSCPVIAVPPAAGRRVGACQDDSLRRPRRPRRPCRARAASLATSLGLDLILAHVVPAPSALTATGSGHGDAMTMLERISAAIPTNSSCEVHPAPARRIPGSPARPPRRG